MNAVMTTPAAEETQQVNVQYEEAKRLFYSYCLMNIGISPNSDLKLIEQLMNENGYAIGTTEDGGTISFGKKRTEPTPDGESYDILAQSDLHSFLMEHNELKYKESLKLPAAKYAEMLDGIDYFELLDSKYREIGGDLVSDGVLLFITNGSEFDCVGKGSIDSMDLFFIDETNYRVVDEDAVEDYRQLQLMFDLPTRYFTQVFVGEGNPPYIDIDGVNHPTFQFKVNISDDADSPECTFGLAVQLPVQS